MSSKGHDEESIFENVLTHENAITELLCNLLRYGLFRGEFLKAINVPEDCISKIEYEDCKTQFTHDELIGKPDLWIRNENTDICIEVKTSACRGTTEYQRTEYSQYLKNKCKSKFRYYFLLAPEDYQHSRTWRESHRNLTTVKCEIVTWTQLYNHFSNCDLGGLSILFREWLLYIKMNLMLPEISLTREECKMLFNMQSGKGLQNMLNIISSVEKNVKNEGFRLKRINRLESEIGFYVQNENNSDVLWFGIWFSAWNKHGFPIWFGVDIDWDTEASKRFKKEYQGLCKDDIGDYNYLVVPILPEILQKNAANKEVFEIVLNALLCVKAPRRS